MVLPTLHCRQILYHLSYPGSTVKWSNWKSRDLGLESPHQDVTKEAVVTQVVSHPGWLGTVSV